MNLKKIEGILKYPLLTSSMRSDGKKSQTLLQFSLSLKFIIKVLEEGMVGILSYQQRVELS